MSEQSQWLPSDDHIAVELRLAVHAGDVAAVQRLLHDNPTLAMAAWRAAQRQRDPERQSHR